MDLTSFLIIRNRVTYAWAAADSLARARERIPADFQLRIVVVDHDSVPEAADEIKKLAEFHGFEHFRYENSVGQFAHWNRVIHSASSNWIHVNHDDDEVDPDFFVEFALRIKNEPDADMFACPYVTMGSNGRMNGGNTWEWDPGYVVDPRPGIQSRCSVACIGFVFKLRLFQEVGGYDDTMLYAADWKFYWEAFGKGRLVVSDRPLVRYRVHEGSLTSVEGASVRSIEEDLDLIEYFAKTRAESKSFDSALYKIKLSCGSAARQRKPGLWLQLFALAVGLKPPISYIGTLLKSLRFFLIPG